MLNISSSFPQQPPLGLHGSHNALNSRLFEKLAKTEKDLIQEYGSFEEIPPQEVLSSAKDMVRKIKNEIRNNPQQKVNDISID